MLERFLSATMKGNLKKQHNVVTDVPMALNLGGKV